MTDGAAAADHHDDDYQNFADIFAEVVNGSVDDPILHLVVLTYEFDEQQLLNLVSVRSLEELSGLRRSHLKLLSDIRPIVFFDARKTKPFSSLPQFLELHPYKTAGYACHHSKAYLIVTRQTIRLVVGSFNLTATGLFRNREVFDSWCWTSAVSDDTHLLREFIDFLRSHYAPEARASAASALGTLLDTLETRVTPWPISAQGDSHLLVSGYGEPTGLDAIASQWDAWFPDSQVERIFTVSPFFDEAPQNGCIAGDWGARFPQLRSLEIVTDEMVLPNLAKAHFGSARHPAERRLYLIPSELSAAERKRIDDQRRGSGKDLVISRALHAKVLLLSSSDGPALAYLGSANFSRKAWGGTNRELGIVWRIDNPEDLRTRILDHLSVVLKDHYDTLPGTPPEQLPKEDEEGYQEDGLFPAFIDHILLEFADDGRNVRFRAFGGAPDQLAGYRITWSGQLLTFTDDRSQPIAKGQFENALLAGRTIEFRPLLKADQCYWFPFQYAGELIAEREVLMHPSSWDWLMFYLYPDMEGDPGDPTSLPGPPPESDESVTSQALEVDREGNCVIAMQRYLNLFCRIERTFAERLPDILKLPETAGQNQALKSQALDPLAGLATLLWRESSARPMDRLFKLGELKLMVLDLRDRTNAAMHGCFDALLGQIDAMLAADAGADALALDYLRFLANAEALSQ